MVTERYQRWITGIPILYLIGIAQVQCYSSGAPKDVCDSLRPGHRNAEPMTTPSPYLVSLNTTEVIPGGAIEVNLSSPLDGSSLFKGFMVIARLASPSKADAKAKGKFTIPRRYRPAVKHVDCDDIQGSSVTQVDSSPKSKVVFNWVAPEEPGEYIIYATFVQSKNVFWVAVPSAQVSVRQRRNVDETEIAPNIYGGCGQNTPIGKGCFGLPENCVADENCDMLVTFRQDSNVSNSFRIQLMGHMPEHFGTNGYIAMGFSKDDMMGSDSVVGCYMSHGKIHVHEYYNNEKKNEEVDLQTIQGEGRSGSFRNGTIICEFSVADTIDFSQTKYRGPHFELSTELLQLLLARGVTGSRNGLQYHGGDRGVSKTTAQLVNYAAWDSHEIQKDPFEKNAIYDGCTPNNCFGIPENCINSKNCEVITKFDSVTGRDGGPVEGIEFELSGAVSEDGPEGSYIAVGISENDKMGSDSVFGCYVNGSETKLGEYYNIPRSLGTKSWAVLREPGEESVLSVESLNLVDGIIHCKFTITPIINLEHLLQKTLDLNMENYFLLLAKGSSAHAGKLGYHSTRAPSPEPFQISRGEIRPRGTCLGIPVGCCEMQKCRIMTTFEAKKEGGRNVYEFTIDAKLDRSHSNYAAVGISDDDRMGSDSVFACFINGTNVKVREFYNLVTPGSYGNSPVERIPEEDVLLNSAGMANDTHMSCQFTVEAKIGLVNQINKSFDLAENPYHILIAGGPMRSNGELGYHTVKSVSAEKFLIPEKPQVKALCASSGLGQESSCAGTPAGCCRTGNCAIQSNFGARIDRGSIVGYDIKLEGTMQADQKYIAFGLSEDDSMGTDSVFACYIDGDTVRVGEFYNVPKSQQYMNKPVKREATSQVLLNSTASFKDGRMSCSFMIRPEIDLMAEMNTKFNLSQPFYILLAGGPMESSDSGLGYHGSLKFITGERMTMAEKKDSNTSKPMIRVELHGALMVIAWILLASVGKFTARYYKKEFIGIEVCGKALWFVIHQFCMLGTVLVTTIAIILIFIEVGGYTAAIGTAERYHPILGLIVFVLSVLQVFLAFCRPDPSSEKRIVFNWVHWSIGTSCHWIGIACIFFSADLQKANLRSQGAYWTTILAFVVFHLVLHVVMSFHTFFMDNSQLITRALTAGPLKPNADQKLVSEDSRYSELILLVELLGATISTAILIYCICESL